MSFPNLFKLNPLKILGLISQGNKLFADLNADGTMATLMDLYQDLSHEIASAEFQTIANDVKSGTFTAKDIEEDVDALKAMVLYCQKENVLPNFIKVFHSIQEHLGRPEVQEFAKQVAELAAAK